MKKIVIFVNRAITSKYNKSLIEQMLFLKEYQKDYELIWVTHTKTDNGLNFVRGVTGLSISRKLSFSKHYEDDVQSHKYSSWVNFYQNAWWWSDLTDVEHVIIFGGMLSQQSAWTRKRKKLDEMLYTKQQMKYEALGRPLSLLIQLCALAEKENATLHEICYDTFENSLSLIPSIKPTKYHLYHGYDIPMYEMKRLDSLTYWLQNQIKPAFLFQPSKEYDLVFGYTVLTKERETVHDEITTLMDEFKDKNVQSFLRHKDLGIDTFTDRDTYLSYIERSKYTLIAKAYDPNQFSIYRFQESINNNCLPLILESVRIKEFIESFSIPEELINNITVRGNKVPPFTESERMKLIGQFSAILNKNPLKLLHI